MKNRSDIVKERIDNILELKDGWYDNDSGTAFNKLHLLTFQNLFLENFNKDLQLPYIFPMIDGDIQLEWTLGDRNIELEVNIETLNSVLYYFDSKTDSDLNISLKEKDGWLLLNDLIKTCALFHKFERS